MFNREKAINYVKEQLVQEASNSEDKFEHVLRVRKYAKTLCNFNEDADRDIVEAAAIFHNIGKYNEKVNLSTIREYLKNEGLDDEFTDRVCQAIDNHDNKTEDDQIISNFFIEDKILIDANMIDQTGVIKAFDIAMQQGSEDCNYQNCLNKIKDEIETVGRYIKIAHTKRAKEILIKNYLLLKGIVHTLECEINGDNM